ncbi:glycosyltransferase [Brevibacterium ihuae]|uniref:glycosyltransferase n=1 Tax=Brevibacterium ihuae TaxID=1631743 RepID=UPI0015E0FD17|nr:hypothetical protein [Brevibacterium ihuae]
MVVGPPHHGVARYGLALVDACAASSGGSTHRLVHLANRADLTPPPQVETDIIHVTFTDHLFGPDPEAAARTVARLVGAARRPGPAAGLLYDPADGGAPAGEAVLAVSGTAEESRRAGETGGRIGEAGDRPRLTVSVHDVPQPAEGEERYARRARGYAALAEQADAVVVNSAHEAAFFNGEAAVIPLPIEDPRSQPPAAAGREEGSGQVDGTGNETVPTVGLLGFVYPGKGYERVIEAVPSGVRVRALGAVAAGHDDYAAQLSALAAERGVDFEVTGYVPDSELAAALDAITVPVCPHRHVSASGSLNTWIARNRRVVVADGPYMREVAERWPERVVLAGDEPDALDLASAIASMLDDPTSAWCAEPPPAWGWTELAAAYSQLWSELERARISCD